VVKKQSFFTLDSHALQTSGFPHREESPFSRACDRDTVTGPKTECLYSQDGLDGSDQRVYMPCGNTIRWLPCGNTYVRRSRPPTPDRIFEGSWAVQLQETATEITVTATRKRRKARLLSRLSRLGQRMDTAHHGRLGSR
jgi:hypothetical protein